MELVKILHIDNKFSWSVLDGGGVVDLLMDWIIHLEEINLSPNTIEAYARHVARLGSYLKGVDKELTEITVADYDNFLQWLPISLVSPNTPHNLLFIYNKSKLLLSSSQKNQIHLKVSLF